MSNLKPGHTYMQFQITKELRQQIDRHAEMLGVSTHYIAKRAIETYLLMNSTASIRR